MSKNIINAGQSFFNKVVECTGDVENAFSMMLLNNKSSLTGSIAVGTELKASKVTDYDVVDYFTDKKKPATLISRPLAEIANEFMFPGEFPFSF